MAEFATRAGSPRAGLFFVDNTNKRGVTCDVSSAAGRELFLGLLRGAAVPVENNLGLSEERYRDLVARKIIY